MGTTELYGYNLSKIAPTWTGYFPDNPETTAVSVDEAAACVKAGDMKAVTLKADTWNASGANAIAMFHHHRGGIRMTQSKTVYASIGDYYHPTEPIEQALQIWFAPLAEKGYELRIVEPKELVQHLSENPVGAILFKENRVTPNEEDKHLWMGPTEEEAITTYVRQGGAWLAWHAGMSLYPVPGAYTEMLRGYFDHHPAMSPVTYTPTGSHPIVAGLEPFEFVDEHYFVVVQTGETEILVTSQSGDGESYAGWAHAYGEGRVACITPAHTLEGMTHPGVQALLLRALQWCMKEL
ncbi:ThuA domain-containing protein [Alicyclobacillus acidiphilus]|uniref:ThuA domain-containing protein n=1 Tax=Alicyclobacillus acidiphilus TaxID=182455 RepID=UPI00146FEA02|nr:ThuA domain-containing protein [Alicyclobacillus acidiphilus]